MGKPKVLIIGCGIAGPVIALLLKKKGYQPIVLEKVKQLGDIGGSLMMTPNGLKVLALLGLEKIATEQAPHLTELRDRSSSGQEIGVSHLPSACQEKYGQPACGVKRTRLNLALKAALNREHIDVTEGWKLHDATETDELVRVISEDGRLVEGSFLIGCDGIKSVTRSLILAEHGLPEGDAEYTGLTQTGGMSLTPKSLQARPAMLNLYGPGAHFICYPISATTTSWAITQRESTETQESWKSFTPDESAMQKIDLLKQFKEWASPVPELIEGAERIIKYGLYDRPQLDPEEWYSPGSGRCVLIGDAAHPTSPHLGQGANQALEDCYHLSRLLPDLSNEGEWPTSETLKSIFAKFAKLRQPRTAALVKGAHAQGVVDGGPEACAERDERLRKRWEDAAAVEAKYDYLLKEPF